MASGESAEHPPPANGDEVQLVDLFAGCGGLTAGFVASAERVYRPVAAVELDLAAAATYAANFETAQVHQGDIADWLDGPLPEADVVVGGPPCQGFSNLGTRNVDDPRNLLWSRYVDALEKIKPKVFLMENVPQFRKSHHFESLNDETVDGRLRDYVLSVGVVRATDFGAAQLRHRFIVIGTRTDVDQIHVPASFKPESEWQTVKDAIGDLQHSVDPEMTDLPDTTVEFFGQKVRGVFKASDLDFGRHYSDLSRRRFAEIPAGGNRFNLPDELKAPCWRKHSTGSYDVMGRLWWNRPSTTIRTEFWKPEKGRYLHPEEDRALSHHEAARLQGFDDSFSWCGTKIQIARQIGNAVPVQLAQGLADHIGSQL